MATETRCECANLAPNNRCNEAARLGHLECLKAAHLADCPFNEWTAAYAAASGCIPVLQWLLEQGCFQDERICASAAICGHIPMLSWAREAGCPWDAGTCKAAASRGHLSVLQFARQHGCPWDERTCAVAAWQNHFELLRWARQNGCPWDEDTCTSAFNRGFIDILLWARRNGAPVKRGSGVAFTLQRVRQQRVMAVMCMCSRVAAESGMPELPKDVLKLILAFAEMY